MNDLSFLNTNRQHDFSRLENDNKTLRTEVARAAASREKLRGLQEKVKKLEGRNNEKLESLESINRNLAQAGKEIKDIQTRN